MSLKAYLSSMFIATLISVICLIAVVMFINPKETNSIGLTLFYSSLFLSVMGLASMIGFVVRFVLLGKKLAVSVVIISFRQAFLIASLTSAIMLLLSQRLFSWLNMSLLIVGFTTLEFLLISFSTSKDE